MRWLEAFKIVELRKRIFFTLALLACYRIGIFITVPGVDREVMKASLAAAKGGASGFLNLFNFFSGGALENMSIFALGIMPYITSSIIMNLMTVVIPSVGRLQKEGDQGRKKINQYTRYGTIFISSIQGVMLSNYLLMQNFNGLSIVNEAWISSLGRVGFVLTTVITLAAGTSFLMWLGERITEKGIGNGISLIIFAGIVARLPSAVYSTLIGLKNGTYRPVEILVLAVVMLLVLAAIVLIEKGQRRIPIQYAKRVVGNKQYGGQSTHLPLKINISGVIPPIFASTLLIFPNTIANFFNVSWVATLQQWLNPMGLMYQVIFVSLIIFFSYFYAAVQFNPVDVSDNMRKFGGFVPGIRPGKATADYIDFVLNRITFSGALYLSAVCVSPMVIQGLVSNQIPFYFGGTGLLIVVGVAIDTSQQIEGHLISKTYSSTSTGLGSTTKKQIKARGLSGGSTDNLSAMKA